MQLGIGTYTFPWAIDTDFFKSPYPLTAFDLVTFAAQYDLSVVQFGDNYPLHQLDEDSLLNLKKSADETDIQIEVGTRRLTVENIETYLAITRLMKAPFLRMVIDDADYEPDANEVMEIIRTILPQLQESDTVLALENHDRFSSQTLKQIIESTDSNWVGICLDTANSFGAGEGIREVVEQLAPYTVNLHIKDFTIKRVPHKMGFRISGCPAGNGLLDVPWLLEEMKKGGRCCTAILEVWSDPEPTPEATIEKEKTVVLQSLTYLKKLMS